MSIPGLDRWLASTPGRHVLAWEQRQVDDLVTDIFGYNALQIGLPQADFLRANRIPLRQKTGDAGSVDFLCDFSALPIATSSTDLVVLPHVLEFSDEPHQILREVERILIPEGQLIVIGFNPLSLWGVKRRFDRSGQFPWNGSYLSLNRLKDWLKLLGFEVDKGSLGCCIPPLDRLRWLRGWQHVDNSRERWWSFSGGVYVLRAIKRMHGMRLITPNWKKNPVRAKALRPITQKETHGH
ncbi:class I SAM-dependent methyltransferase [Dechloromonas sp. XY25]|uniref:Class I SAM-dependent methyltransferase n=1 Tax=Dechloromonas hankyongensis TaxID=2908002 RepID=A0ABS9K2L3_9RHOO|nr:class I SAM-dependent methyltransferase [Dechloromonas hankyongensis]MCG2577314.1 class I SAM-dependent methyltransferase [Dechloromonas hankyongensis]